MADDKKKAKQPEKPKPVFAAAQHPADVKAVHLAQELKYNSPLLACRIDPSGQFVFATAQDFTIQRWRLSDSKQAALLKGHESWIRGMAFLPDGTLISGGFDSRLVWWQATAEEPKAIRTIENAHQGWVRAVAVSPDGKQVATCGNDHLVKLWTAAGEPVREMTGHASHVYNVAWHPAGRGLVSMDLKGVAIHWDPQTGNEVRRLTANKLTKYDTTFRADIGGARSIAFSGDGRWLACGGITNVSNAFAGVGKPAAVVFDWEDGQEAEMFVPKNDLKAVMWGLAFHPGGFLMGASGGGSGGYLHFWKGGSAADFHQLKLKNVATDLAMHPDGLQLAVSHYDNQLRLYKLAAKPKAEKAPAKKK